MPLNHMGWQRKPLPALAEKWSPSVEMMSASVIGIIEQRIVKRIPLSGTHRNDLLTIFPVSRFCDRQLRQVYLLDHRSTRNHCPAVICHGSLDSAMCLGKYPHTCNQEQ